MCGIFGYVGERRDAAQVVLNGLKKLEYRGYDSWGVAVGDGDHAALDRRVGKIAGSTPRLPPSQIGLGHTRWATHGAVNDENAHPQLDCARRSARPQRHAVERDRAARRARTDGSSRSLTHRQRADRAPDRRPVGANPGRQRAARARDHGRVSQAARAQRDRGLGRADRPDGCSQERLTARARSRRLGPLPGLRSQRAARAHTQGSVRARRPGRAGWIATGLDCSRWRAERSWIRS